MSSNLGNRLDRLEEALAGNRPYGSIYAVQGGGSHTEADVRRFLAGKGIEVADNDMIVFRRIVATGPNGSEPTDAPLTLRFVGGRRHDDWVVSGALDNDTETWGSDDTVIGADGLPLELN